MKKHLNNATNIIEGTDGQKFKEIKTTCDKGFWKTARMNSFQGQFCVCQRPGDLGPLQYQTWDVWIRSCISTIRPTVHTNPLRKRFCKTLFKLEEFKNGAFWKWWRHYNDAIFLPIDLISSVPLIFIGFILQNLIKSTVLPFIQRPSKCLNQTCDKSGFNYTIKTLQLPFKKAKTYH